MKKFLLFLTCMLTLFGTASAAETTVTDVLTKSSLGITTVTNYNTPITDVAFSSGATYSSSSITSDGNTATANIQAKGNTDFLYVSNSPGKIKSIEITLKNGASVYPSVYASNSKITSSSGTATYTFGSGKLTWTPTSDYKYFCLKAGTNATYLASIKVTWVKEEGSTGGGGTTDPDPGPTPGGDGTVYSTTISSSSFENNSAYTLKTFEDYTYGFTYKAVVSISGDKLQFNLGNKNGGAGSAFAVTSNNPDYIIKSIEINGASNGLKVYSSSTVFNSPVASTAFSVPSSAKQLETSASGTKTITIENNAFLLIPSGTSLTTVSSIKVNYVKAKKEPVEFTPNFSWYPAKLRVDGYVDISQTNNPTDKPAPQMTYSIVNGSEYAEISDNRITGKSIGTVTVKAEWEETQNWLADETTFDIEVFPALKSGDLQFRHKEVEGKYGVGVVSQAAWYLGDRSKITYKSSDETVVKVDPNNGMIRTADIMGVGEAVITASVPETDEYAADEDSYRIIISTPEIPDYTPDTDEALFDFRANSFGLFDGFEASNTNSGALQGKYEHNLNSAKGYEDYIPKEYIETNNVTITFGAEENKEPQVRYFTATNQLKELRVYTGTTLTFSVPEGYAISSITFQGDDAVMSSNIVDPNETENSWSQKSKPAKWNAPSRISSVTFNVKSNIKLYDILVEMDVPGENVDGKVMPELTFAENRIINTFVGNTVELPTLSFNENVDWKWIHFDIDEIEEFEKVDDEENEGQQTKKRNYAIESDIKNELYVKVDNPGVYTFRASIENSDENNTYGGMAILRLNVFPHFDVLPSEGYELADDKRNSFPGLTIVHPDADSKRAEIKLPNLEDMLAKEDGHRYSTLTVKEIKVNGVAVDNPDTYQFEEDGVIEYTLQYAGQDDFVQTAKVNVVLMPQVPEVDDTKTTITPSQNAKVQYVYVMRDDLKKKSAKRHASGDDIDWDNADVTGLNATLDVSNEDDVVGVYYRSLKDLPKIDGLEDTTPLVSDYELLVVNPINLEPTYDEQDLSHEWNADGIGLGLAFLEGNDDFSEEVAAGLTITVTPKFETTASVADDEDDNKDDDYTPIPDSNISYSAPNLNVVFPCSGLYEVKVASNNPLYTIGGNKSATVYEANIYPSLDGLKLSYVSDDEKVGTREYTPDSDLRLDYEFEIEYDSNNEPIPNWYHESCKSPEVTIDAEGVEIWYKLYRVDPNGDLTGTGDPNFGKDNQNGTNSNDNDHKMMAPSNEETYGYTKVGEDGKINIGAFAYSNETEVPLAFILKKNGAATPMMTNDDDDPMSEQWVTLAKTDVKVTGVDSVEVEAGEAEYYTVDGVKVANPDKGIYIKVEGGKAVKVVI